MGSTTLPLWAYELIQAVIKYEDEHPKIDAEEHDKRGQWCFQQWLSMVPEEHRQLATMLDDLKVHLNSGGV